MAEPKRGSVAAFKAAEERRKARVASKGKFKIFGKAGSFDSPKSNARGKEESSIKKLPLQ